MRIRKVFKRTISLGLVAALALSTVACGKDEDKSSGSGDASKGVQKVKVAWQSNVYLDVPSYTEQFHNRLREYVKVSRGPIS